MREGCPLPLGGYGGPPPDFFFGKNGAIWCILRSFWVFFLNALKHYVYGAGKSFFTAPPPIIRPFWKLFYSLKHHVYGVGKSCRPHPPKKKERKKKKKKKKKIKDIIKYIVMR